MGYVVALRCGWCEVCDGWKVGVGSGEWGVVCEGWGLGLRAKVEGGGKGRVEIRKIWRRGKGGGEGGIDRVERRIERKIDRVEERIERKKG